MKNIIMNGKRINTQQMIKEFIKYPLPFRYQLDKLLIYLFIYLFL